MSDRFLIALDAEGRWALLTDAQSWVIAQRTRAARGGHTGYVGRTFPHTKSRLLASLDRFGIELTPAAQAYVDALPSLHGLWRLGISEPRIEAPGPPQGRDPDPARCIPTRRESSRSTSSFPASA